jgi:hypothetical protein
MSWADQNAPLKFASAITYRETDGGTSRAVWDRADDAVEELRRILPDIVKSQQRMLDEIVERGWSERRIADLVREDLETSQRLWQALPERRLFAQPPSVGKPWHRDAARLFRLYKNWVNPKTGISPNGPAVRFIEATLRRMGHTAQLDASTNPRGAIAQCLRRRFPK